MAEKQNLHLAEQRIAAVKTRPLDRYGQHIDDSFEVMPTTEFGGSERRSRIRYPITLDLRFRMLDKTEADPGSTVNLSSQGSLITAENHGVRVGAELEILVVWPVLLNRTVPLGLRVIGRVVRSDKSSFAVAFTKTELRDLAPEATGETSPAPQRPLAGPAKRRGRPPENPLAAAAADPC